MMETDTRHSSSITTSAHHAAQTMEVYGAPPAATSSFQVGPMNVVTRQDKYHHPPPSPLTSPPYLPNAHPIDNTMTMTRMHLANYNADRYATQPSSSSSTSQTQPYDSAPALSSGYRHELQSTRQPFTQSASRVPPNVPMLGPPPTHAYPSQSSSTMLAHHMPGRPLEMNTSEADGTDASHHHHNHADPTPSMVNATTSSTRPIITSQPHNFATANVPPPPHYDIYQRNMILHHPPIQTFHSPYSHHINQSISQVDTDQCIYKLTVVQQPLHARMCGFGEKDRRPVDPPPIVKLNVFDATGQEYEKLQFSPFFVLHVTLRSADDPGIALDVIQLETPNSLTSGNDGGSRGPDADDDTNNHISNSETSTARIMPRRGIGNGRTTTRVMMGTLVSSPNILKDTHGNYGSFFCFPDLSIRCEGVYRLRFTLVKLGNFENEPGAEDCSGRVVAEVDSDRFTVYSAKRFPGMTESTPLSKAFARQGLKIPIRNDVRKRNVDIN